MIVDDDPSSLRFIQFCKLQMNTLLVANFQFLEHGLRSLISVVVVDPEAYTYDNEVIKKATYDDEVIKKAESMGKLGLVEIYGREDSFVLTVESTDAVKPSQIVTNAIEVLKQKLDAVRLSEDTEEADEQFGELGAHMRGG